MVGKTYRVVLLFLLVLMTTGCGVNNTVVKQARSQAEVDQYLAAMTPGLTRAQELGLVTPLNIEIPVPEANTAVHLEKIWYNSITNERGEVGFAGGLPVSLSRVSRGPGRFAYLIWIDCRPTGCAKPHGLPGKFG
ncbi:hypothetical protein MOMUL_16940 [Moorella mulderi DSM 14980]|uniref:Lipoprotein n=1 Tax=Moorella mulderi DSM 14980 TaxID=1122241 RepID=A0A151AWT2_9FIRM|nr:hypothetical protein MOMUL_16940 [Moorella mulderi DSM 14980]